MLEMSLNTAVGSFYVSCCGCIQSSEKSEGRDGHHLVSRPTITETTDENKRGKGGREGACACMTDFWVGKQWSLGFDSGHSGESEEVSEKWSDMFPFWVIKHETHCSVLVHL